MHDNFDVRRFTAVDMFGAAGTARRRRTILAEFVLSCPLLILLGASTLLTGHPVMGIWFLGVGLNYLPLALYAVALFPSGALEAELTGMDIRGQLRRASLVQLLLLVPFLVAVVAAVQSSKRPK